ncbi:MAG: BolA family protein [Oleiphilus sp.]
MSRQQELSNILTENLQCDFLEVVNESHQHNVPENSETHFKVTIVSSDFGTKSKVARHQLVYGLTRHLMDQGLHALALHTYLPAEWQQINEKSPDSPNCMGGSK